MSISTIGYEPSEVRDSEFSLPRQTQPLDGKITRVMKTALKERLVYSGKGIEVRERGPNLQVHQIVQYLLGKGALSSEWINLKNTRGVLIQKDPALLRALTEEFRVILNGCAEQLPLPGTKEEVLFKAFVGNILALLPYCYPEEGDSFSIPQKIDGEWKKVLYKVDRKIELTPKWLSSPIAAYGLVAEEGPPLLTFLGTTYPAGEGFIATLFSDVTPGLSVGHAPYLSGKEKIKEWFQGKEGIHLYGISLGGALAFHVLRNHKEKIGGVDVYNPPGLYPWNWKETYCEGPEINIYTQENDLVGLLGAFPCGDKVTLYRVITEKKENSFKAHMRVYTGGSTVAIFEASPEVENSRFSRKLLTALHFLFGVVFVFIPVLCTYLLYRLFTHLSFPGKQLKFN